MLPEKAKTCEDCLCWLKYCKAECCSRFQFPVGPRSDVDIRDGVLRVRIRMTPDRKWYFELHGIEVQGAVLHIPEENCHFMPTLITVHMRCVLLAEGNLCLGHPDKKPKICQEVTLDNARRGTCELTPNCLFQYK